jgi:hypothetical protein
VQKDSWKREIEYTPKVSSIPTQIELNFKPAEASEKEFENWEKEELDWWANKQLLIVAIAVVIQFSMLGFMFLVMGMNQVLFNG